MSAYNWKTGLETCKVLTKKTKIFFRLTPTKLLQTLKISSNLNSLNYIFHIDKLNQNKDMNIIVN